MPNTSLRFYTDDHANLTANVAGLNYDEQWLEIGDGSHELVVHGSLGQLQEFAAKVTAAVRAGIAEDRRRRGEATQLEARVEAMVGP